MARYTKGIQNGGDHGYIAPEHRWFCATGSFLKTNVIGATTYSERAMYAPTEMGYCDIVVEDGLIREVKEVQIGHE